MVLSEKAPPRARPWPVPGTSVVDTREARFVIQEFMPGSPAEQLDHRLVDQLLELHSRRDLPRDFGVGANHSSKSRSSKVFRVVEGTPVVMGFWVGVSKDMRRSLAVGREGVLRIFCCDRSVSNGF